MTSTTAPSLSALFAEYPLTETQRQVFANMKGLRNMPDSFKTLADEELIWNVAVGTIGMPASNPTASDLKFYQGKVEERLRRLDAAESQYRWFSLEWTKATMTRLVKQWFCGMLVLCPDVTSQQGHPIQFVHEYYGDDSGYPYPDDQTDEWKQESMDLYVLMARSICKSYPMSVTKGIVSFSDMQDFDWNKYDMGTKERNANIGAMIPNKLFRMIAFHPDEKMIKFYNDMTPSARRKFGFEQYDDFESTMEGEKALLPSSDSIPVFVGGTKEVDILDCLKHLFRREPHALELLMETHAELVANGELPKPKHMEYLWK